MGRKNVKCNLGHFLAFGQKVEMKHRQIRNIEEAAISQDWYKRVTNMKINSVNCLKNIIQAVPTWTGIDRFQLKRLAFLAAGFVLLGTAGSLSLKAGSFPTAPTDENTYSLGLFRLHVLNKFQPMMGGTAGGGGYTLYYGYGPSSGTFTSPLMADDQTQIGLSLAHCLDPSDPTLDTGAVLVNQCSLTYPAFTSSYSGDPATPLIVTTAGSPGYVPGFPTSGPYNEVFTYMENFQLEAFSNCVYTSSQVNPPDPYVKNKPMVIAGALNGIQPSRGRMVSGQTSGCVGAVATPAFTDYSAANPAMSYFLIYVNVLIPAGPGTDVGTDFYLYNDPNDPFFGPQPLIIENTDVESLPPGAIYYHGGTLFAVPVKFLTAGHDASGNISWNAGDTFGTLTLSGHELGVLCGQSGEISSNFVNEVLGPPGQSVPEPPTLWAFPTNAFPCPGVAYSSLSGTNFGGGSMDQIVFSNTDYGTIYVRNLIHSGFTNNINPPAFGTPAVSINNSSSLSCEVSLDDTNFYSALGVGSMNLSITNVGGGGKFNVYNTGIVGLTNILNNTASPTGPFILRASLIKSPTGQHSIVNNKAGTCAASYFDVTYELRDNAGATWYEADRSIRLQVSEPVCGVAGQNVYIQRKNGTNILSWASSSYTLQGTTNLTGSYWVNIGTNSPVFLSQTNGLHFFRTVCN
jgi:hypothetical protein